MHRLNLLVIVFGIILSGLAYAEDEDPEELNKKGLVVVEPVNVIISRDGEDYALVPYRERRPRWGVTTSIGYSTYEPINYEPDFVAANFSDVYKTATVPMLDLLFSVKRNMGFGSIGVEFGAGYFEISSSSKETYGDSTLNLIPARLGLVVALDTLTPNPIFVPYFAGGAYTMVFDESLGGNSHNGNTQVSGYFHGGVAFSLHWIDRHGAIIAYRESGVEATYAYLEVQKYMQAGNEADGDFSNEISYSGGLRLEF